MEECVEIAREFGKRLNEKYEVPVYFYEEAATRPERRNLENVRKGQYEGLKKAITEPERLPDIGQARLHPTAGATVVGARKFLVAFNVTVPPDRGRQGDRQIHQIFRGGWPTSRPSASPWRTRAWFRPREHRGSERPSTGSWNWSAWRLGWASVVETEIYGICGLGDLPERRPLPRWPISSGADNRTQVPRDGW